MNHIKKEKATLKRSDYGDNNRFIIHELLHIYGSTGSDIVALEDFNLNIKKHEFLAIMGPSGSGKTTLMKILTGLIRHTSGDITLKLNGGEIVKFSDLDFDQLIRFRLNYIGYIQQQLILFQNLNVYENILLPKLIMLEESNEKMSKEEGIEIQKKADEILKYMGIYKRRFHNIDQISGGEKQRVVICSALMKKPEILIADEPTGELDSDNAKNIFKLFKKISSDKNMTVICATHNNLVREYADRVVNIIDGKRIN